VRYLYFTGTNRPTKEPPMRVTTPPATCTAGHLHASWYAAQTCGHAPLPSPQQPLTQAQRAAVVALPCSA